MDELGPVDFSTFLGVESLEAGQHLVDLEGEVDRGFHENVEILSVENGVGVQVHQAHLLVQVRFVDMDMRECVQ